MVSSSPLILAGRFEDDSRTVRGRFEGLRLAKGPSTQAGRPRRWRGGVRWACAPGGGPAARPDRGVPLAPHPRRILAGSFRDPSGKLAGSLRDDSRASGRRKGRQPKPAPPAMARRRALGERARRGPACDRWRETQRFLAVAKTPPGQPSPPAAVRQRGGRSRDRVGRPGWWRYSARRVRRAGGGRGRRPRLCFRETGPRAPARRGRVACRARPSPSRKPGCSSTWGQPLPCAASRARPRAAAPPRPQKKPPGLLRAAL